MCPNEAPVVEVSGDTCGGEILTHRQDGVLLISHSTTTLSDSNSGEEKFVGVYIAGLHQQI